jgi:hypothetical protein
MEQMQQVYFAPYNNMVALVAVYSPVVVFIAHLQLNCPVEQANCILAAVHIDTRTPIWPDFYDPRMTRETLMSRSMMQPAPVLRPVEQLAICAADTEALEECSLEMDLLLGQLENMFIQTGKERLFKIPLEEQSVVCAHGLPFMMLACSAGTIYNVNLLTKCAAVIDSGTVAADDSSTHSALVFNNNELCVYSNGRQILRGRLDFAAARVYCVPGCVLLTATTGENACIFLT